MMTTKAFKDWGHKEKLEYFESEIYEDLKEAFKRGDKKYRGADYFADDDIMNRTNEQDIAHVGKCHVGVRLAEAEDLANSGQWSKSLDKITSAIGYLIILHSRINRRY